VSICEVGSGLNGKRPKLARILSDPSATMIVVEHRDRLAQFGVGHLQAEMGVVTAAERDRGEAA
jgi:putative resolvase